jgi:hypothetical protein
LENLDEGLSCDYGAQDTVKNKVHFHWLQHPSETRVEGLPGPVGAPDNAGNSRKGDI